MFPLEKLREHLHEPSLKSGRNGWLARGEFIPEESAMVVQLWLPAEGLSVNTLMHGLKNMDCYADTRRLIGLPQERLASSLSRKQTTPDEGHGVFAGKVSQRNVRGVGL